MTPSSSYEGLSPAPQGGEETNTKRYEVGNRQRMAGPAFGKGETRAVPCRCNLKARELSEAG